MVPSTVHKKQSTPAPIRMKFQNTKHKVNTWKSPEREKHSIDKGRGMTRASDFSPETPNRK